MLYKELNLKELREKCDIDFAHYTYKRGQCSCCYGPTDMAKRYWKNGEIKQDNYTFILFKNADNGSGHVVAYDKIKDIQHIEWALPPDKLVEVCKELQAQMPEYTIFVPKEPVYTIIAVKVGAQVYSSLVKSIAQNYTTISNAPVTVTTEETTQETAQADTQE